VKIKNKKTMEKYTIDNSASYQKNMLTTNSMATSITVSGANNRHKPTTSSNALPANVKTPSATKALVLPRSLKHIKASIDSSRFILELTDNWDENGALKVSKDVYFTASTFLKKYGLYILNDLETIISAPEINPVKDGSIDLEWHTPHARMLINVRNNGEIAYYGDNNADLNSIKGKIMADTIQKFLAVWMTKLTTN
jgi:hypothetical protein